MFTTSASPGFACSIHATWGPTFSRALHRVTLQVGNKVGLTQVCLVARLVQPATLYIYKIQENHSLNPENPSLNEYEIKTYRPRVKFVDLWLSKVALRRVH